MNKKHIIIAVVVTAVIAAAYASKIKALPIVGSLAAKLPGADA